MKSGNITNTTGRVKEAWTRMNNLTIKNETDKKIKEEVDKSKIHLGELTKFYPYLDKAEVKITNKRVVCKILHRMAGSLIDFFTPEGEGSFCTVLNEPCILPREKLNCLVIDINDNSNEWLLLGYYIKDDIIFNTPAQDGYYKITDIGATNNWGISIGDGEVKLSTNNGVTFREGEYAAENETINYTSSENVYTKDEVDKIVSDAISNLKKELQNIGEQ